MDRELSRELRGLEGDKKMSQLAIKATQNTMKENLLGDMGNDMMSVLNGEQVIELTQKEKRSFKIKNFIRKIFRSF